MDELKTIEELILKVRSYDQSADTEFLKRVYFFSSEAHGIQTRKEGTPFISHPLAVSFILADMHMDTTTIAAGLLHDTIEDTLTHVEDIKKRFGYELAFLVESVTKLSKIEFKSKEEAQAENFRRMLLSMVEDTRVIMIKFADRLHNMRTLQFLPESKRQRIAQETLDIYAPIANRLGIGWLKTEFEDISFKHLMPKLYGELVEKVAKRREEQEGYITNVIGVMENRLKEEDLEGKVYGRVKHYYGIYQKMQLRELAFEEVHDVLGVRIITDTKANCYAILGLIHSLWTPIPGKFKDYIGVPKSNMYQSLHTTVIGPGGERVEFQIRTDEMDRVAEEGIAAHWRYKEKGSVEGKDDRYISWLRDLVQVQKEMPDAREFIEAVKAEVIPNVIYVFTPNGDVKELPYGSTPIDFAYTIHTAVGHKCVGAKANGRIVPLKYKLHNGDTIEIITSPTHTPSRDWLGFVATQKAKSRIKQWINTEERKQSIELGIKLIETELRKHSLSPSLIKSDEMASVATALNFLSTEDLVVSVGYGKVSPIQVIHRLQPEKTTAEPPPKPQRQLKEYKGVSIKGIDDILYHIGKCCRPVPGDNLVGLITRGRGVTVHRRSCRNLDTLSANPERLVDVDWNPPKDAVTLAKLEIESMDKTGILASLSSTISASNVNIHSVEANPTPDKKAHITFTIEVTDRQQLQAIIQKIAQTEGVLWVKR